MKKVKSGIRDLLPKRYVNLIIERIKLSKKVELAKSTIHNQVSSENEAWEHWDCVLFVATQHQKKLKGLKLKAEKLKEVTPKRKKIDLKLVAKI